MKWKDIPLPDRMKDLPKSPQGYPVPFVVLKDDNGVYHFKINDSRKQIECFYENLCSICGKNLDELWFVGGQESAFHPQGVYVDSAMHRECAHYALQVCPYLAMTNYSSKIEMEKLKKNVAANVELYDPTQSDERLPFFVLVSANAFRYDMSSRTVKLMRPYLDLEFWKDGKQVSEEEIKPLLKYNPKDYVQPDYFNNRFARSVKS